jgi:pimeloyl-ACP methyl ester carboxylesterase
VIEYHSRAANLDWSNRPTVIDYMVGGWRLLSGSARPFDEQGIRAIAEREANRARNPLSAANHALLTGGERWMGRLHEIRAPTLVIHGTEDIVLPHAHGLKLARELPRAELLSLEGVGHELHPLD